MTTNDMSKCLEIILPNYKIIQDIIEYTWGNINNEVEIEFEELSITIPRNTSVEIITKAFYQELFDVGFGTGYRVLATLGNIKKIEFGIIYSEYCFVTLYYNTELKIFTLDYHLDMIPRNYRADDDVVTNELHSLNV